MELKHSKNIDAGTIQIKRYMDFNHLVPNIKTYKKPTFAKPIDTTNSENLVKDFNVDKLNTTWAHDNAEFKCLDGKVNVLVLQDLATRECINLRIAQRAFNSNDVTTMIASTLIQEQVNEELIIMADNGTEGKNKHIREFAKNNQIKLSYSEPGKSWQNGVVESLIKTSKTEIINDVKYMSMKEASIYIIWWFKIRYNKQRYHSYKNIIPCKLKENLLLK